MFQTLHLMFETQYNELALAVDLIAERIRALGAPAPGSYREFGALSAVPEDLDHPDATEMIRRLVAGQETVARTARSLFPIVALVGPRLWEWRRSGCLVTSSTVISARSAWPHR